MSSLPKYSLEKNQEKKYGQKNLETFVLFIGSTGDKKKQILISVEFFCFEKRQQNFGRRWSIWFLVNSRFNEKNI